MIVQVYRNLHKNCYSVRDKKSRKVVDHKTNIILKDATFKVSEAGRQRVLRNRVKNVHAWVEGEVVDAGWVVIDLYNIRSVKYNPYEFDSFVDEDGEPIEYAQFVVMKPGEVIAYQEIGVEV